MARCKSIYEKPDRKIGKPIRCILNSRRQHDTCRNGTFRWENKTEFVPKKKREHKTPVNESDNFMVRAVGKYRDSQRKR